jgi:hypothetical protein
MNRLWSLLGYDQVANDLLSYFRSSLQHRVAVIDGPPGSGKSTFALGLAAAWRDGGGRVAILEGDDLNERRDLYPFQRGISALDPAWSAIRSVAGLVPKLVDLIAGTGGGAALAVAGATRLREGARARRTMFMTPDERRIIADLERAAGQKPLLLIADNIHWWDAASLSLLQQILSPEATEAYPFLAAVRVVAVRTTNASQPAIHADFLNRILLRLQAREWHLRAVRRDEFPVVLEILADANRPGGDDDAAKARLDELSDLLFMLSNGHFALAWKAADYVLQGPSELSLLGELDEAGFIRAVFEERLISHGAFGEQGLQVLEFAALIGLTFRHDELACLAAQGSDSLLPILALSARNGIIEIMEDHAHFRHDYFRRYFRNRLADRASPLHAKFADCLRQFRPGDYLARFRSLALGGQPRAALTPLALHAIQNVRTGFAWDRSLTDDERRDLEEGEMARYLGGWRNAWSLLARYEFQACLEVLDRLPVTVPKALAAEADFLRASCLLATRREADRRDAYELLKDWLGYKECEPELGIRLAQLYLYAQVHVEPEGCHRTERQIIRFLSARTSHDPAAVDQIYKLQRCASSLYVDEIAVDRVAEAVAHFAPAANMTISRDPLEYYRCLTNYVAELISTARYDEALTQDGVLSALIDHYGADFFPRTEYPKNNGVLAAYRAGLIEAREAFERIGRLVETVAAGPDPYYLQNSLAVYAMLAGNYAVAGATLEKLLGRLTTPSAQTLEPNMVYLIRSNHAGYLHLTGQSAEGLAAWREIAPLIDSIPYTFTPYFRRKHELMLEAFQSVPGGDAAAWDRFPLEGGRQEVGPCWDNFGRGFRMPEIEFWRDN